MKKITTFLITGFIALLCNSSKAQLTLPYYTDFDTPAEQAGWQLFKLGVDGTYGPWGISKGGFSDSNCIYHDYNNTGIVEDWHVSTAFNFTQAGKLRIKVRPFVVSGMPASTDYIGVRYSSGNQNPDMGSFTEIANITNLASSANNLKWIDTTVNLPFRAGKGYIGFKYKNAGNWFTISLDNIRVSTLTSGINGIDKENTLHIHPNPCNGIFNIILSKPKEKISVEVYNAVGILIYTITNNGDLNAVDVRDQANGLYFVKVIGEASYIATLKIIKQ